MKPSAPSDTLEVVSFTAGACRFAVEAWQIEALSHAAPASALDALDAETLLGLPSVLVGHVAQRRWLRCSGRELRVSEPLDLRPLPADRIFPLPELVARRLRIKGVCAVALEPGGATLLIDLRALLTQANSEPDKYGSNHNDMPRS